MTGSMYLNRSHFVAMVMVALAVHLVLGVAWILSPGLKVTQVPVHVLNIKLGSGDLSAMTSIAMPDDKASEQANVSSDPQPSPPPRENARSQDPAPVKTVPDKTKRTQTQKNSTPTNSAALNKSRANRSRNFRNNGNVTASPLSSNAKPTQYVRRSGDARGAGRGSALGNTVDPEANVMQRYTQLISMWINRHNAIMNRAVQPGMKGNVVIRLRIDRMGNIHHFSLDKATGVPIVDAAAADMVRAANPVPPVPSDYPGGNMFEFLISVGYTFQQ
ncbi:MAG: TonB family protein [Alphaproteobacteria bacterium]|nr:TonB family protein [Alphaproteobacteria bacterium]